MQESGLLKIQVLWNILVCQLAEAGNNFENIMNYLAVNTA